MKTLKTLTPRFANPAPALIALALMIAATSAQARTKLVALPERSRMIVNLQNPNSTLAIEERTLALTRGMNQIDFSWQGVSIDAGSIQIQMLDTPDETNILSVEYPPNENALVWQIFSPADREENVRITYLLNGINRETQYRITASEDEKTARLQAHYTLMNQSGEDLDEAELLTNWTEDFQRTIESGESRKLTALNIGELPIEKIYRLEPGNQSPDPEQKYRAKMFYQFENTEAAGLGNVLLPRGKYRIFQKDPQGSTIFVGEDWGKELAVREEQKLFLGMANDIVVKRVTFENERKNVRRNNGKRIVAYDEKITMRYEVDNFKDEAAELTIVEPMSGYWELVKITGPGDPKAERKSNSELELTLSLPAESEKQVFDLVYVRLNQLN